MNIKKLKLMQKNKKGSHVGIVLSIVIFVGFLLFLYTVVEPAIKTKGDKEQVLESLEVRLLDQLYANLTTVTISATPNGEDCLTIIHPESGLENLNSTAKDEFGNSIGSESNPESIIIDRAAGQSFFKVYYSEESFDEIDQTRTPCGSDYSIGSVKTDQKIFETKITNLLNLYREEYGAVKEILKVPLDSDFSFSFQYSNKTIIGSQDTNVSLDIYAKEAQVQYVDKQANINQGVITLIIW